MLKQWKLWVGVLISAVAIYFAVKDIKFDEVGDTFSRINWWLLALSFIPYFLNLFMKIPRWQLLFSPGPMIPLRRLWATLMMSYFFNTVLPARLGEVVRGYALARSEKIGVVRVFSTILLEKILDVMTMFIFLLCLLPFLDVPDSFRGPAFLVCGLVVAGFVVCILMAIYRQAAERLIGWFLRPFPPKLGIKLAGFANEILDVLGILLDFKLSFNIWAQSILLWLFAVANYFVLGAAIHVPLNFQLAVLLTVAINLGMVVPSAPGYVGVFEFITVTALSPFLPDQHSLLFSFGLLLHVSGYLPVIILGAYYTSREGVSFNKLSKASADVTSNSESIPPAVAEPSRLEPSTTTTSLSDHSHP